jgi:hypothetical protein
MRSRLVTSAFLSLVISGCAGMGSGRNFLTDSPQGDSSEGGSFFSPQDDFPVMAGDSAKSWGFEDEQGSGRSSMGRERDRTTYALERELVGLEDSQSESNLAFYNLHKNKFNSTSEKIYFLKLPKGERTPYLISKGIIKQKKHQYNERIRAQAIRHADVMMGMSKNDVVDSWGRPVRVEVAGNPSYENERWAYNVNGATKYIYFESGKVGGWE